MKDSMRKVALLAIVLLVSGALFVPAVSATYEQTLTEQKFVSIDYNYPHAGWGGAVSGGNFDLGFYQIEKYADIDIVYVRTLVESPTSFSNLTLAKQYDSRPQNVQFTESVSGKNIGYGTLTYNIFYDSNNIPTWIQYWVDFDEWDVTGLSGTKHIRVNLDADSPLRQYKFNYLRTEGAQNTDRPVTLGSATSTGFHGYYIVNTNYTWSNIIRITDDELSLIRNNDYSILKIESDENVFTEQSYDDRYIRIFPPISWTVTNTIGTNFTGTYSGDDPGDPGKEPTPDMPVMRTGSVTMTDNNGTTITGFNVTAINAYTGENYTVSTDTDVAVMTLPMDRTITIRNPQTGEYEEAPIGYYRFYGQASGYKMLNEEGIQVAVMPEKYTSYELCIILVTPESGPLTGKHQFQIRSRSDNTVLQTGTISAKSATTGDWYNTTVSGGIATIILPYDTSNSQSQYAGNYYVYATSPGYEDSDYGTQIVVMPQTVSEIRSILLTPIGGIPPAGNVTLRIQAFSETGPGIPNAEIFIAGVDGAGSSVWDTYTASSTGYLTVSVPGNSTYDIVASGDGYYDSARRIEVFTDDPPLIEIKLYLSGTPTLEPTTQPTGWPTDRPTTQPPGGIPDEDDDSEGFLMQAVRGIGLAFGVGFATAKLIFGMLLALSIGYTTAKQLRGGAAEFGLGLLGGTLLGVLIGLLPVWIIVVLLLVVGLYIGNRYVGGGNNG